MRSRFRPVLGVLALLLVSQAAPAAGQETQDTTKLPQGLRTARATMTAAFAKLDGAAAGSVFADSSAVDFQGQLITGKTSVGGWFQQMFSTLSGLTATGSTFVIKEGEVRERAGYTVFLPDGSQQNGTTETVWMKQPDGSWKVSRLIVM